MCLLLHWILVTKAVTREGQPISLRKTHYSEPTYKLSYTSALLTIDLWPAVDCNKRVNSNIVISDSNISLYDQKHSQNFCLNLACGFHLHACMTSRCRPSDARIHMRRGPLATTYYIFYVLNQLYRKTQDKILCNESDNLSWLHDHLFFTVLCFSYIS